MKRLFALLLALTLAVSLVGCGPRQRAEDGKLQVVCTVFPYYDFARQIGGDDVDVTLLVAAGKETHSFEPTPLDVITLSESDVFLYNGGESEAWVEDILSAAGENIAVTLPLMPQVSALAEEWAEGMEGGHDDHDHDHDSEDHSHDSDDIEYDEHVWTSPVLAKTLCQAICDALCQADPAHQEGYQSRLTDYLASWISWTKPSGTRWRRDNGGCWCSATAFPCCTSARSTGWTTGQPSTAAPATRSRLSPR